jgi:hypothetical protein
LKRVFKLVQGKFRLMVAGPLCHEINRRRRFRICFLEPVQFDFGKVLPVIGAS